VEGGLLACTVTGATRFSYGCVPLREQRWRRGFQHLADRLALPDDSLNSYMLTCLHAGLNFIKLYPPREGCQEMQNVFLVFSNSLGGFHALRSFRNPVEEL
jgi:hypothetical protein